MIFYHLIFVNNLWHMIQLSLIPSTEGNRYERSSLSSLGSGPTHTGYLSDTKHATFHGARKNWVEGRVYDVSNAFSNRRPVSGGVSVVFSPMRGSSSSSFFFLSWGWSFSLFRVLVWIFGISFRALDLRRRCLKPLDLSFISARYITKGKGI